MDDQPPTNRCETAELCQYDRSCPFYAEHCRKTEHLDRTRPSIWIEKEAPVTDQAYALSEDGMTLVVKRRAPGGILTTTVHRQRDAGPFTDADIAAALSLNPDGKGMQPGQHNRARRAETRFGTVWTDVMTGPPTWWLPKLRHEKDGTIMAGWLRLAVAVKVELGRAG